MKLSTASFLLSAQLRNYDQKDDLFKLKLPIIDDNHHLSILITTIWYRKSFDEPSEEIKQLVSRIFSKKYELYRFFYTNKFIGHQSCMFVYHQLKVYSDLTKLISEGLGESGGK